MALSINVNEIKSQAVALRGELQTKAEKGLAQAETYRGKAISLAAQGSDIVKASANKFISLEKQVVIKGYNDVVAELKDVKLQGLDDLKKVSAKAPALKAIGTNVVSEAKKGLELVANTGDALKALLNGVAAAAEAAEAAKPATKKAAPAKKAAPKKAAAKPAAKKAAPAKKAAATKPAAKKAAPAKKAAAAKPAAKKAPAKKPAAKKPVAKKAAE